MNRRGRGGEERGGARGGARRERRTVGRPFIIAWPALPTTLLVSHEHHRRRA